MPKTHSPGRESDGPLREIVKRWPDLTLECGHQPVYLRGVRKGRLASYVRCLDCKRGAENDFIT